MALATSQLELFTFDNTNIVTRIPTTKPKVISLFCGCGGFDYGFHQAGYEIVFANDIDPAVEKTYRQNLGEITIKDIKKIDNNTLPVCDVILAGIPCQPFSSAGNRNSVNDERGGLFQQVIETLKAKNPQIVVFENVRGFLSAKDENGLKMPDRISLELKKIGYKLYFQLLNASDYEVPQNRYRVFLVGVRNDLSLAYKFPFPVSKKANLVVKKVIEKPLPLDEEKEIWDLSPQSLHLAQFIPPGGSWKNIPDEELPERLKEIRNNIKKYRSPNFYRRFNLDEIMGTITAAATPEHSGILHPLENRRYSVREIARFQSFPDDFKFVGCTTAQKYKMIGNAVPCRLAFYLAKSIKLQYFSDI
jgi:DNA (cytosine-5)-methyltransferase 1